MNELFKNVYHTNLYENLHLIHGLQIPLDVPISHWCPDHDHENHYGEVQVCKNKGKIGDV